MNIAYEKSTWQVDNPNVCPHCHVANHPRLCFQSETLDTDDTFAHITIWECGNIKCSKLFVALYKIKGNRPDFERFLNGLPKGPDWPVPIIELKRGNADNEEHSKFIKTYLQSLIAEQQGLDELAGMGYRKAIEYLIKDWAIQNHPDDKEKIESFWLGGVIDSYYKGDLKDILERATWLGNDQSHYKQLFEEFDLNILKELIGLIMAELDREYKKAHYIELIKSKK